MPKKNAKGKVKEAVLSIIRGSPDLKPAAIQKELLEDYKIKTSVQYIDHLKREAKNYVYGDKQNPRPSLPTTGQTTNMPSAAKQTKDTAQTIITIAQQIRKLKEVVASIGKDNAKELIDLLTE